jgi:hypothetical protein
VGGDAVGADPTIHLLVEVIEPSFVIRHRDVAERAGGDWLAGSA